MKLDLRDEFLSFIKDRMSELGMFKFTNNRFECQIDFSVLMKSLGYMAAVLGLIDEGYGPIEIPVHNDKYRRLNPGFRWEVKLIRLSINGDGLTVLHIPLNILDRAKKNKVKSFNKKKAQWLKRARNERDFEALFTMVDKVEVYNASEAF